VAVYEGVLHKVSEGEVISSQGTGGYYTNRVGIIRHHKTGVDDQAGWTRYHFVDIGETRIRNVMLMPYQNALLREAIGEEIALSMTGPEPSSAKRHTVLAIRTPKGGVNRPSEKQLWAAAILNTLRTWLAAVIGAVVLFVVLFAVAWGIYAIFRYWPLFVVLFFVGVAVALAVFVWLIVAPIVDARRMFRAAAALDADGTQLLRVPSTP
jgi:hypothetical protein